MFGSVIAVIHHASAEWAQTFCAELVRAFGKLGLSAHLIPLDNNDEVVQERFRQLTQAGHAPFLLDINGRIESENVAKFSWVVDHPLCHPQLAKAGSQTVLGMIDMGHAALSGYTKAPIAFVPHGGPEPGEPPPWSARDIDVLFVGDVPMEQRPADQIESLALVAGERAAQAGTDPFMELMTEFERNQLSFDQFTMVGFARLLSMATEHSQHLQRIAAIRSIRTGNFHVAGTFQTNRLADLGSHVTVHGAIPSFAEIVDLMRRSKIVVNVTAKFPHGSHERIWYGMANGCAVITNRSSFMERDFVHGEHILYYSQPEQIGALVEAALHGDRARAMAQAARPIYEAGHTWTERAQRILAAMNQLPPPG